MARTKSTLLQRLILERRITREEALRVLYRRAERMHVDDFALSLRQLDRWLAGQVATLPRPAMCRVIEAEFGHPVERLLAPVEEEPLPSPSAEITTVDMTAAVAAAAGQSAVFGQWADSLGIGDLALTILWQRLANLATAYVHAPMLPVFREATVLRDEVFELLASPDPAQARNLYLLAGTTCGLLAHASGNLGNLRAARVQASTALVCARKAEHSTLAAWVLGVQALQAEWTGHAEQSLALAAQAQLTVGGERLASTVPVWLAAIEARAHARRGDGTRARTALRRATELRERVPDEAGDRNEFDSLGGILTFTEAKQHYYAGTTYRRVGDFPTARTQTSAALTAYAAGPTDQRSYGDEAIAWVDLATAHASGDRPDLDSAAGALTRLAQQPAERSMPTLLGPLRDLTKALTQPVVRDAHLAGQMRATIAHVSASCQRLTEIST